MPSPMDPLPPCHSRESGNPGQLLCRLPWTPAFALVLLSQKAAGQRWGESDKEEDSLSGAGAKMGQPGAEARESRFAEYVEGLASVIGHADRERPLRDYCLGLMLPCERKSVEPIAAVTAPARVAAQHQSLLHFVNQAAWSDDEVLAKVRGMVTPSLVRHGPIEAWIVDDTGFP